MMFNFENVDIVIIYVVLYALVSSFRTHCFFYLVEFDIMTECHYTLMYCYLIKNIVFIKKTHNYTIRFKGGRERKSKNISSFQKKKIVTPMVNLSKKKKKKKTKKLILRSLKNK